MSILTRRIRISKIDMNSEQFIKLKKFIYFGSYILMILTTVVYRDIANRADISVLYLKQDLIRCEQDFSTLQSEYLWREKNYIEQLEKKVAKR